MNFIPFYFSSYTREIFFNNLLNIFLTIPFGFGINFVKDIKKQNLLWSAILVGLTIETLQFIISLSIGFPYRTIDINDIIMNALGVIVGFCIFKFFGLLYIKLTKRYDIQHAGLSAYIENIIKRQKSN
jgi:glycopeptide antibiotics resistance protein